MNYLIPLTYCYGCILTLLLIFNCCNSHVASLPDCTYKHVNDLGSIIFVSTLDGYITALNGSNNGSVLWAFKTGPDEMLSSTIQNQELTNNGMWIRMIPSLSGGLYKYDGKYVDVVPVSIEELLTSSFRYSDDLVFSGGKKTITFGISIQTGQIFYECSMSGCQNFTQGDKGENSEKMSNIEGLLVIQKHLQTLRAIVPHTGSERWNFSVAEHDLKVTKKFQCHYKNPLHLDLDIFAIVPEAIVYATKKHQPNIHIWKTQLNSPIVNVWRWQNGELEEVEMFSGSQWTWNIPSQVVKPITSPSVYIGMYNSQLYIHESVSMKKLVNMYINQFNQNRLTGGELQISVPRIPWKLFPASSDSLAIIDAKNVSEISSDTELSELLPTSLSEYVDGNGYYLYAESETNNSKEQCNKENITIEPDFTVDETHVQIIIVSLWFWWKEVTIISITTAIIVNMICSQRNIGIFITLKKTQYVKEEVPMIEDSDRLNRNIPESIRNFDFKARFKTDFDLVAILGKGGFGVVFEAKNKIDDCHYAVKRISLPNCDESKDRVMREVKALAKLEHHNIVRYYTAWVESPPNDWDLDIDSKLEQDVSVSFSNEITAKSTSIGASKRHIENTSSFEGESFTRNQNNRQNVDDDDEDDSFIVFEKDSVSSTIDKTDDNNLSTKDLKNSQSFHVSNSNVKSRPTTQMFLYIQMQLCQRESLKEWMCRHLHRTKQDVQFIFEQIIHAVEYVHLQGLIHRDLKPSNIFFSLDGKIKVGDFGLVTDREDEETVNFNCDKTIVKKNSRKHTLDVGTQLYMSPEQLEGYSYNYKVDIYSLGVIFFELLIPFTTEMERIQVLKHLRSSTFPEKFQETFTDEHNLLQLMLSKSPEKRPTTMGIRARPPFLHQIEDNKWHFDLPYRKS